MNSGTTTTTTTTSPRRQRHRPHHHVENDDQIRAPPSVMEKLKAFTSAEEFGEELFIALIKDLFQSFIVGFWLLLKRFGNWLYRLGYFMLFGIDLGLLGEKSNKNLDSSETKANANNNISTNTSSNNNNNTNPGFPSPFPSFYRDAFFSTWSPHELLEPRDLPMTNAFMPTPLPRGASSQQQAAEMLRPTPAPPFWWIGMMEISGRHFIESQWAQSFSDNVMIPAMRQAREMWCIHEDEVMRGSDLVARVVKRGDAFDNDVEIEDQDRMMLVAAADDPYRYRVNQGGPFREL